MSICDTIEQRISTEGVEFLRDDAELAGHAAACPRCADLLTRLSQLNTDLETLPRHDASDGLVERVLEQVRDADPVTVLPVKRRWLRVFSTAAMLVLTFGVLSAIFMPAYQTYRRADTTEANLPYSVSSTEVIGLRGTNVGEELADEKGLTEYYDQYAEDESSVRNERKRMAEEVAKLAQSEQLVANLDGLVSGAEPLGMKQDGESLITGLDRDRLSQLDNERRVLANLSRDYRGELDSFEPRFSGRAKEAAQDKQNRELLRSEPEIIGADTGAVAGGYALEAPAQASEKRKNELIANSLPRGDSPAPAKSVDDEGAAMATPAPGASRAASEFLTERDRLSGLEFKPATGYWANTYVPGDASIRYLQSQLERWADDGTRLSALSAHLVQTVMPNRQPFDAPGRASLDVFMHSDKMSIEGVTRMRVQIGIKAADRKGGHRPSMNVAVVVDPRTRLDAQVQDRIGGLLRALGEAGQPGDNFSLLAAGDQGVLIAPGEFRHGTIEVALGQLFEDGASGAETGLSLPQTISLAAQQIETSRSGQGALGTNLVLLLSTAPIGDELGELQAAVHRNALGSIALSVVSLGGSADLSELDSLVLLGQGHRRIFAAGDDARAVIEGELRAASRAVARALRLRIRLADGVKLVDVMGSRSLAEEQAERVREAETSIDQTLARELGIEADRGEDEEGIQIVIPSFYAGDHHVILLDVVVDAPGPVADVTLRYKDLLERENGVARAALSVASGNRAAGLLELNVLKNQVTYLVTESARRASQAISAGDLSAARADLEHMRLLVQGLRAQVPGWRDDGELRADESLLAAFVEVLSPRVVASLGERRRLADSLAYVAARRLLPAYEPER